ncbi:MULTISPECIES: hypothetical protein [Actinoalloteichus]|uniref:Alcohol dehydrogenase n=1 Tax=Actinoalloteichus fjordicus TaxID=1612552 RepID=A0AAC9LB09_9PSEU|nr:MULTISPECIES: hypothetical protein [Actinoalloteichus]APU13629.1 hypothetical protein UA74_07800 [Actinoalloteichus fjordicus]APU19575.1 hypothetical protein UA75_07780 [Actinoalloteichus sp. GBA129-24]
MTSPRLQPASTLLGNALTARLALDALAVPRGGTVAVTGAAGAGGGYAVELAKADGLTVIADAAPADAELVLGLGADHVVDRGDEIADRTRGLAPDGVPGLLDGSMQTTQVAPAVADGGALAEVRGWAARPSAASGATRSWCRTPSRTPPSCCPMTPHALTSAARVRLPLAAATANHPGRPPPCAPLHRQAGPPRNQVSLPALL